MKEIKAWPTKAGNIFADIGGVDVYLHPNEARELRDELTAALEGFESETLATLHDLGVH